MSGASPIDPQCDTPMHAILGGLEQRLKLVFPLSQGFAYDFVPARVTPAEWKRLTRRAPWFGIGWSGLTPDIEQSDQFVATSTWFLALATKNPGGPRARLAGDALGPGLFNMVHLATVALQGFRLSDAVQGVEGTIQIGAVATEIAEDFMDENLAVAQLMLTVRYEADAIPGLDTALGNTVGDYTAQGLNWSFSGAMLADTINPPTIAGAAA